MSRTGPAATSRAIACGCPNVSISAAVMQAMLDAGIATRRGIMCAHREACYASGISSWPLANSEAAQDHCIILPLYPQMTEEEQDTVIRELKSAIVP